MNKLNLIFLSQFLKDLSDVTYIFNFHIANTIFSPRHALQISYFLILFNSKEGRYLYIPGGGKS